MSLGNESSLKLFSADVGNINADSRPTCSPSNPSRGKFTAKTFLSMHWASLSTVRKAGARMPYIADAVGTRQASLSPKTSYSTDSMASATELSSTASICPPTIPPAVSRSRYRRRSRTLRPLVSPCPLSGSTISSAPLASDPSQVLDPSASCPSRLFNCRSLVVLFLSRVLKVLPTSRE